MFVRFAVVKAGTFILLFLPLLPPLAPISAILDLITRISLFKGGIFEDKGQLMVCEQRSREMEAPGFAELTYAGIYPSHFSFLGSAMAPIHAWLMLGNEKRSIGLPLVLQTVVLLALLNSSTSFFLFSFHVYEKMILLPLLPFILLLPLLPMIHQLSGQECWGITLVSTGTCLFSTPRSDYNGFIACSSSCERTDWLSP